MMRAVAACRTVADDKQRLDCFMEATQGLEGKTAGAAPPAAVSADTGVERRRMFGFARPRAPAPKRAPELKAIALKLVSATQLDDGRVLFRFEDGSAWQETEPAPVGRSVHPGEPLTIERGLLGGYFLDVPGRAAVRVRRDREG